MQEENKETNNISQTNKIQTSTHILTHSPFNPFGSNENVENSLSQSTQINNVHLERPYLNEIQNEEPKNINQENNNYSFNSKKAAELILMKK